MKELFVPYTEALALKELDFDEPCLGYHTSGNEPFFVLLSSKISGELVGHGSVRNSLFKWLKENDKTSGELYTLSNSVTAPTYAQAFKFFRDKYGLYHVIEPVHVEKAASEIKFDYLILGLSIEEEDYNTLPFHTYEEAELACLRKLIELIKEI